MIERAFGPINGGLAGERLVHDAAKRIDIAAAIDVGFAERLFGTHVIDGADCHAGLSETGTCGGAPDASKAPRAMPKSASIAWPWRERRMFSGFTSR